MENKPNKPQAFPNQFNEDGMTLRDYFANSAMQTLLRNVNMFEVAEDKFAFNAISKASYKIADVMLKQREDGSVRKEIEKLNN